MVYKNQHYVVLLDVLLFGFLETCKLKLMDCQGQGALEGRYRLCNSVNY